MDLTEGSETSAKLNLTPGKYPKENIQDVVATLKGKTGTIPAFALGPRKTLLY
jgi:hypothetical protein